MMVAQVKAKTSSDSMRAMGQERLKDEKKARVQTHDLTAPDLLE